MGVPWLRMRRRRRDRLVKVYSHRGMEMTSCRRRLCDRTVAVGLRCERDKCVCSCMYKIETSSTSAYTVEDISLFLMKIPWSFILFVLCRRRHLPSFPLRGTALVIPPPPPTTRHDRPTTTPHRALLPAPPPLINHQHHTTQQDILR